MGTTTRTHPNTSGKQDSSRGTISERYPVGYGPLGYCPFSYGRRDIITDLRILAEVRRLIASNKPGEGLAGFIPRGYGKIENACIEEGCSCNYGVCGPWRNPPIRCLVFEHTLLADPTFSTLADAYWSCLRGEPVTLRIERCRDVQCRKRVVPGSAYCEFHTGAHERQAKRATRMLREERALERARRGLRVGHFDRLAAAGE